MSVGDALLKDWARGLAAFNAGKPISAVPGTPGIGAARQWQLRVALLQKLEKLDPEAAGLAATLTLQSDAVLAGEFAGLVNQKLPGEISGIVGEWNAWAKGAKGAEVLIPDSLIKQALARSTTAITSDWQNLAASTQSAVAGAVAKGSLLGKGVDAVAAELRGVAGMTGARARLIARTELADARDHVSMGMFRELDVQAYVWKAKPDACPICQINHNRAFSADQPPNRHHQCRCLIIPLPEDEIPEGWQSGDYVGRPRPRSAIVKDLPKSWLPDLPDGDDLRLLTGLGDNPGWRPSWRLFPPGKGPRGAAGVKGVTPTPQAVTRLPPGVGEADLPPGLWSGASPVQRQAVMDAFDSGSLDKVSAAMKALDEGTHANWAAGGKFTELVERGVLAPLDGPLLRDWLNLAPQVRAAIAPVVGGRLPAKAARELLDSLGVDQKFLHAYPGPPKGVSPGTGWWQAAEAHLDASGLSRVGPAWQKINAAGHLDVTMADILAFTRLVTGNPKMGSPTARKWMADNLGGRWKMEAPPVGWTSTPVWESLPLPTRFKIAKVWQKMLDAEDWDGLVLLNQQTIKSAGKAHAGKPAFTLALKKSVFKQQKDSGLLDDDAYKAKLAEAEVAHASKPMKKAPQPGPDGEPVVPAAPAAPKGKAPAPRTESEASLKGGYRQTDDPASWEFTPPALQKAPSQIAGGAHRKVTVVDADGNVWLFKPQDDWRSFVDVSTARVQAALGLEAPAVTIGSYGGRRGAFHLVYGGKPQVTFPGKKLPELVDDATATAVQKHMVLDWIISNHDGHAGQFVFSPKGAIVGIDKGQAFKFLKSDRLSLDFNPNAAYGEVPVWQKMLPALPEGQLLTRAQIDELFDELDRALPPAAYRELMRPYASAAWKHAGYKSADDLLEAIVARRVAARADVHRLYEEQGWYGGKATKPKPAPRSAASEQGLVGPTGESGEVVRSRRYATAKEMKTIWVEPKSAPAGWQDRARPYTGSGYSRINGSLRSGTFDPVKNPRSSVTRAVEALDEGMAPVTEARVFSRGVGSREVPEWSRNPEALVGKVIGDDGYMSTSARGTPAFNKDVILHVTVRPSNGPAGVWAKPFSAFSGEDEFIIRRGARMVVTHTERRGGTVHIYTDLVDNEWVEQSGHSVIGGQGTIGAYPTHALKGRYVGRSDAADLQDAETVPTGKAPPPADGVGPGTPKPTPAAVEVADDYDPLTAGSGLPKAGVVKKHFATGWIAYKTPSGLLLKKKPSAAVQQAFKDEGLFWWSKGIEVTLKDIGGALKVGKGSGIVDFMKYADWEALGLDPALVGKLIAQAVKKGNPSPEYSALVDLVTILTKSPLVQVPSLLESKLGGLLLAKAAAPVAKKAAKKATKKAPAKSGPALEVGGSEVFDSDGFSVPSAPGGKGNVLGKVPGNHSAMTLKIAADDLEEFTETPGLSQAIQQGEWDPDAAQSMSDAVLLTIEATDGELDEVFEALAQALGIQAMKAADEAAGAVTSGLKKIDGPAPSVPLSAGLEVKWPTGYSTPIPAVNSIGGVSTWAKGLKSKPWASKADAASAGLGEAGVMLGWGQQAHVLLKIVDVDEAGLDKLIGAVLEALETHGSLAASPPQVRMQVASLLQNLVTG